LDEGRRGVAVSEEIHPVRPGPAETYHQAPLRDRIVSKEPEGIELVESALSAGV
jgi:hypothetical protein